ncbi:NAD-dependent epimerase/dehydratase family protein [Streptomyces sp. NPDC048506]|uniref:NAD-dependent epimerase/dehydratase family protein n=1 Tax=Streptomyces sp. NPDC048506 TaxID=3155028 RepID=UPI00342679C9
MHGGTKRAPTGLVTVTGSSGLVGSALAAALDAAGWVVRGVDRIPGRWTSVVGDLRDRPVRLAALQSADVLVHTAALHAPHVGRLADEEFRAVTARPRHHAAVAGLREQAGIRTRLRRQSSRTPGPGEAGSIIGSWSSPGTMWSTSVAGAVHRAAVPRCRAGWPRMGSRRA